jgi:hypothetical protein
MRLLFSPRPTHSRLKIESQRVTAPGWLGDEVDESAPRPLRTSLSSVAAFFVDSTGGSCPGPSHMASFEVTPHGRSCTAPRGFGRDAQPNIKSLPSQKSKFFLGKELRLFFEMSICRMVPIATCSIRNPRSVEFRGSL